VSESQYANVSCRNPVLEFDLFQQDTGFVIRENCLKLFLGKFKFLTAQPMPDCYLTDKCFGYAMFGSNYDKFRSKGTIIDNLLDLGIRDFRGGHPQFSYT